MAEPFQQLDDAMNRRRVQLRMNWREVADAAGISYTALRAIRKGEYRPAELTARRLDDALQWMPGSVYAILAGGEPTAMENTERQPSTGAQSPPLPPATPPDLLSPQEALRRAVRATARELGVTPSGVDEVMQLVRQDLEGSTPEAAERPSRLDSDASLPGTVRTDLSDIVREGRRAAGLSLEEVAARAVDPSSGEHVIDAAWLDRLELNTLAPEERPEYPQLDALVDLLNLDPVAVQDAAGVQFHGVHTIWSEDGQVRGFSLWELTDPKDIAKARALMEEYGRAPQRRRDG